MKNKRVKRTRGRYKGQPLKYRMAEEKPAHLGGELNATATNPPRKPVHPKPKPKQLQTDRRKMRARPAFWFKDGKVVASRWAIGLAYKEAEKPPKVRRFTKEHINKFGEDRAAQGNLLLEAKEDAWSTREAANRELMEAETAYRNTEKKAPARFIHERLAEVNKLKDKVPFSPMQNIGYLLALKGFIGSR